jgi:hypothetical protein
MGGLRNAYETVVTEHDHLGDTGVEGRKVLKWFLNTLYVRVWTESIWLKLGTRRWSVITLHERSGTMKRWKFLDQLQDY